VYLTHKCTYEDHTDVKHSFDVKGLDAILLISNNLTVITNTKPPYWLMNSYIYLGIYVHNTTKIKPNQI